VNIIGIIPARMASSRFPGKPMKNIFGMPMIGHCLKRSLMSKTLSEVYVATCDKEIFDYVISIDGKAILTSETHERASDRVAEALNIVEKRDNQKVDIVVMLQGDEPMTTPEMIDLAIQPLLKSDAVLVSNLYNEIKSVREFNNPNEVKVVIDNENNALYFSREPIPSRKKGYLSIPMYKQVCVIPFRRDFLIEYNKLKQTPLEIIESIDMLRILENGIKIKMVKIDQDNFSVDTPMDLKNVISKMSDDKLMSLYL
jgi:3-deoxy-manno-octulosonate cytidylyltransferase (CMP-KDO synthetase)